MTQEEKDLFKQHNVSILFKVSGQYFIEYCYASLLAKGDKSLIEEIHFVEVKEELYINKEKSKKK